MNNLYVVGLSVEVRVWADSEEDAVKQAKDALTNSDGENGVAYVKCEIGYSIQTVDY